MFESAELGRKIDKAAYEVAEAELRTRLLTLQNQLRGSGNQVMIIVAGVEGAGKTEVVNRFSEWFDTRGLQTHSFWGENDDERARPWNWRFWRRMPARGSIGLMFGSWYTRPIIDRATGKSSQGEFDEHLRRIKELERLLADDGALIIKLWFHIDKKEQAKRIRQADKAAKAISESGKSKGSGKGKKSGPDDTGGRGVGKAARHVLISPMAGKFSKLYDEFAKISEHAIRASDTDTGRWYIVESTDRRFRDLSAGKIVAAALERHFARADATEAPAELPIDLDSEHLQLTVLDRVDLTQTLEREEYRDRIATAQERLYELAWRANKEGKATVAVFEGWDAAGKGGAVRRLTQAMDARLYRVVPIAAPTDEERAQHYLWRFWRHLPHDGRVRIYDRSWYGRVLVERVEGFATQAAWRRAYHEINAFEEQLHSHGVAICKFWIHISKEEQLRRFEARAEIPWKQHKITDEDWRNREQWDAYRAAINDMVARTSTSYAPWTLVAGNDKKFARVQIIETFCDTIERGLQG